MNNKSYNPKDEDVNDNKRRKTPKTDLLYQIHKNPKLYSSSISSPKCRRTSLSVKGEVHTTWTVLGDDPEGYAQTLGPECLPATPGVTTPDGPVEVYYDLRGECMNGGKDFIIAQKGEITNTITPPRIIVSFTYV